jgi:hypothetical protein
MPNPTATIYVPYTAIDDLTLRGTRAAQPAASAVTPGTLYCVTDAANALERSNGTAWEAFAPTGGGGGGAPAAHHATHETGGSDALAALDAAILTSGTLPNARLSIDVLQVPGGYPGGTGTFLRADGGFALPPSDGTALAKYRFDTALTAGPPSGDVRLNVAYPYTGVTTAWFSKTTDPGNDATAWLLGQPIGANIYIQNNTDATQNVRLATTALGVDSGTYITFAVTWLANGAAAIPNNTQILVEFNGGGAVQGHHATHETGGSDALAALSAAILTSGILPDARLSSNIPRLNQSNTFAPDLIIQGSTYARQIFTDPSQAANARAFAVLNYSQQFTISAVNDALTANASTPLTLDRAGNVYVQANLYEKQRATPLGHWTAIPYNASNFTTDSGTLSFPSGNVYTYAYSLVGKTITLAFYADTGTITGTPGQLRFALPAGITAAFYASGPARYFDGTTSSSAGELTVSPAGASVALWKDASFSVAWGATAALRVRFTFTFGMQ